jgi:Na+/proline symporter/signal transduction histidine kinase
MDIGATGLGLIDYGIFITALVAVLVVGLIAGGKVQNLEDYALSTGKRFSMPVLTMTLIVTAIGSNASIGTISEVFNVGYIYLVSGTLYVVGPIILISYASKFMAGRYNGNISLYGVVEQEYGEWPAKLSGVISIFLSLVYLSMQIIGMGYVAKTFLGVPFLWGTLISTVVFVAYSSVSGIRGVVYTDVLQFFIVLFVFPVLVGIVVYKMGGVEPIFAQLPQEKKQVFDHPDFVEYVYLTLFWMMPFGLLRATFIQRFLMCGSGKELSRMGMSWILFDLIFFFMVCIIGLASISLLTDVTSGKEVIPTLMKDYFPIGFKGVAITAFFAVIMSTADSELNVASVLLVETLMGKEERKKYEQKKLGRAMGIEVEEDKDDRRQVKRLRKYSLILGGLAFLLALVDFSLVKGITIASAIAFGAVNIPIFFAPFKRRKLKSINAYMGSIVGGLGSYLILLLLLGYDRIYMVSFYSLFFTIAGWFIGANFFDKNKTAFWVSMKMICRPSDGFEKLLFPPEGYGYIAVFGIISFLMRYGLNPWDFFSPGYIILSTVFVLSCVSLFALGFGDTIRGMSNKLFIAIWLVATFLSLPLYNMITLLQEPDSIINFSGLLISVFLVSLLFDWRVSLLLLLLSFAVTSALNASVFHQEGLFSTTEHVFLGIYVVVAGILVSLFLKRMTDSASKEKLEYAYTMAGSVAHELQTPIMEVGGWLEFVPPNSLDKDSTTQDQLNEIEKVLLNIRRSYNNSIDTIRRTMQVFTMGKQGRDVVDTDLNMAELVAESVKTAGVEGGVRARIKFSISPDFVVHAYANNLITIFHNLIKNAAMYSLSKDKKATIRIYNEGRDVIVYDDGVGIRSDRILTIFDRGTTYDSKRGSGFGLYYCKLEMERLGGAIRCYSRDGEFTKFVLSFPEVKTKKKQSGKPAKRREKA